MVQSSKDLFLAKLDLALSPMAHSSAVKLAVFISKIEWLRGCWSPLVQTGQLGLAAASSLGKPSRTPISEQGQMMNYSQ